MKYDVEWPAPNKMGVNKTRGIHNRDNAIAVATARLREGADWVQIREVKSKPQWRTVSPWFDGPEPLRNPFTMPFESGWPIETREVDV